MKRLKTVGQTLDHALGLFRTPSAGLEASVQERVAQRLGLEAEEPVQQLRKPAPVSRAQRWQWPALATTVAAIMLVVLLPSRIVQSAPAVLEDANGSRKIQYGELVRPTGEMSAMLSMADGPRVETRSMSEFRLERTDDGGTRIHLNMGGLIVDAASQRSGNLVVQTKEITALVSGAVSLVKAGEEGSSVAAIGGEVRVQQGTAEKKLAPGEQLTSNPKMESIPVREQVAWSRQAEAHMALLPQAATAIAPPKERVAFEIVSIRPSGPAGPPAPGARGLGGGGANSRPTKEGCSFGTLGWSVQLDPGRMAVTRTTVFHLIAWAYPVPAVPARNEFVVCVLAGDMGLVSGGPEWIKTDMWDIQAGIPAGLFGSTPTALDPKIQQMVQTMLAEHFKLSIRRETREMPVDLLVQASGGAKFNGPRPPNPARRMMVEDDAGNVVPATAEQIAAMQGIRMVAGSVDARKVTMSELANEISLFHGRPVFDRTGLTGAFDFYLDRPPAPEGAPRVTRQNLDLGTAIRAVGLRLEESKAPIDVWVIERVEKPSAN